MRMKKVVESALFAIASAFVAGILTSLLADVLVPSLNGIWNYYPQHIRVSGENAWFFLTGVALGILFSLFYLFQRSFNRVTTISSWGLVTLAMILFGFFGDDRSIFLDPRWGYILYSAILTAVVLLLVKSALIIFSSSKRSSTG